MPQVEAQPEILKDPEIKDPEQLAVALVPNRADHKRMQAILAERFKKLEKIKADIPLKTYHLLQEKLAAEQKYLEQEITKQSQASAQENIPQSLPKTFFEKRSLKPKMIRAE